MSSMGERLAWARNQQGMTLQQVSERSELAIGYISQLEKGAKVNPTLSSLDRLARALHVTVEFILGNVKAPTGESLDSLLMNTQAWAIGQRFARLIGAQSPEEHLRMTAMTVEKRFSLVVDFLCREYPEVFTRPVIAFQLGLSVRSLNSVLEGWEDLGINVLHQMTQMTSIPLTFFASGEMESARSQPAGITPAQILEFMDSIRTAVECGVTPRELLSLIREHGVRK